MSTLWQKNYSLDFCIIYIIWVQQGRSNYNIANTILFLQNVPIKYSTEARLLFTGLMRVCHAIVWSLYAHSFLDMISLFYYSYSRFQEHVINPLVLFPSPNAKPQVPPKAYVQTNPGRKTGRHHSDMMYDYIPIQQIRKLLHHHTE